MLPTPSTDHVLFQDIYEPAEDSYLLLDTIASPAETKFLKPRFHPASSCPLLLEVGTGSGVIIAFLAAHAKTIFGREDVLTFGVDVNVKACSATVQTVGNAVSLSGSSAVYLGSICGDLVSAMANTSFDLLVFNPPYIPSSDLPPLPCISVNSKLGSGVDSDLLSFSYAGGVDGVETTYRLLKDLPRVLSSRGVAYVLLCLQNRPERVKEFVTVVLKLQVETVATSGKTAGWEKLQIIRIWR